MSKNHNFFFKAYLIDKDKTLCYIHVYRSIELFKRILAYNNISSDYNSIYNKNIKNCLYSVFPEVINLLKEKSNNTIDFLNDNVGISFITEYEYRENNERYDNEMKFVEYISSEQAFIDKNTEIDEEILKELNFKRIDENWERSIMADEYYIEDYSVWKICTINVDNYENSLNIHLSKGNTNNGALWHVHIDNNACMTIGSADISTVWQFNTLMQVFGSKFRL